MTDEQRAAADIFEAFLLHRPQQLQALAALDSRIASLQAMDSTLRRIETQCRAATNDLSAALADVLRLQASGGQQANGAIAALAQRLEMSITWVLAAEVQAGLRCHHHRRMLVRRPVRSPA